jgi:hypothetical protein
MAGPSGRNLGYKALPMMLPHAKFGTAETAMVGASTTTYLRISIGPGPVNSVGAAPPGHFRSVSACAAERNRKAA